MVKNRATQTRRPVLAMTLALALIFLILGEAAYQSEHLLEQALHPQTSADLAALVCTSLKTQNYAQLTSKVDPEPTPTDSKVPTLADQLRGIDNSKGKVTTCTYQLISENDTSAQYALTLMRTKLPVPMGLVLVLRFHGGGTWMISPETDFTGTGQPR
jgi:hypothetical protein